MTAEEIYSQMKRVFAEKTGFEMEDTADLAVRLYAAAAQLETLYAYCDWALGQSFPQTAAGAYLDEHAALRGLTRAAGSKASGSVRFTVEAARSQAVTIPAGTVCTTAGLVRYATTADAVIAAGSLYADAAAEAEEAGAAGNAAAGTVCLTPQMPAGVAACGNPQPFAGGADAEDDESLRARVLASYARLPNGANAAFYETRAMSHAGVGGVSVLPRVNGVGTVGVVVATASGEADAALLEEIRADLEAVREIAVDVSVRAPEIVTVDLTAELLPADNVAFDDAKTAAEAALGGFFTGARLGKAVYLSQLTSLIYAGGLVKNVRFTAPAADVAVAAGQLPRLGSVTITEGV